MLQVYLFHCFFQFCQTFRYHGILVNCGIFAYLYCLRRIFFKGGKVIVPVYIAAANRQMSVRRTVIIVNMHAY